jgi:tripartite ATP-independent transporter DctP family solute receptor
MDTPTPPKTPQCATPSQHREESKKYAYLSFGFLIGLVAASLFFALLKPSGSDEGADVRRIRVAHSLPVSHPVHAGIEHFAERLAVYSSGRLRVDIFPNSQLGSEPQTVEQMQAGTLDGAKIGAATLGSFVPTAKVFSLPYLFRDSGHYWTVLGGPIGQELLEMLAINGRGDPSGLHGLTFYDAGSRSFYAQRPILHPDDLRGLKVRVQPDPVAMDTIRALGASPTPISWGELYTALQQGVVDGAENNAPSFVSSRHFEVCKEFSLNHHSRVPDLLMLSQRTWASLSEEEQAWVRQAANDSSVFQREAWDAGVEAAFEQMRAEGVTVHEVDVMPFLEATEPVRQRYGDGAVLELT